MLFNVALFSSLLLVPAVLAAPSGIDTRAGHGSYNFLPNNRLETALSNTQHSQNWAGAVWAEGNGTFSSVTGTFTAPTPSGPTGASASAWVGIDGDTCTSAILQTGIAFTVENGQPAYYAWYEWYPAPSANFTGITVSAGDIIQLTVTAPTATSGTATIENMTKGQIETQFLTSTSPLCGENAEWIVEDYMQGGGLVPFADFGTVTFTNAVATGAASYTPSGATIFDIDQNNQVLTSTSTSELSVTIKYV